jgi:uncharacterized membrane protein
MRRRPLAVATLAALVVGVTLVIVFDQPALLTIGVLALVAFIVLGLFLVATPEFLGRDDDLD